MFVPWKSILSLAVLCWLGNPCLVPAQEVIETPSGRSALTETLDGVVVLKNGHVFAGRISSISGGYRVDAAGTYAIVPYDKVDVIAENRNQAYVALRDRNLKPNVEDHLRLAEWCLHNNLIGQARTETSQALKLEPLRPEARQLMLKIDAHLNAEAETSKPDFSGPAMTVDGFLRSTEQTSAGLSRQVHQEFIRNIQPLLLNKCGNAYCHGLAANNGFRLTPIRRGRAGNRLQSQENLNAVLQQIDDTAPAQSPLLTRPVDGEAAHRRIDFVGRNEQQYRLLSDWVAAAVGDRTGSPGRIQENDSAVVQASAHPPDSSVRPDGRPVVATTTSPADFDERTMLEQVRQQARPDPFDPERFNRRVHGATARELRESGKLVGDRPLDETRDSTPVAPSQLP